MRTALAALALILAACGGGGGGSAGPMTDPAAPGPSPSAPLATADITLLFMGNSHTTTNNVPGMVAEMVRAARPGKSVAYVEAPDWMSLQQRANDAATLQLMRSRNWSFIVLQAQDYSQSGTIVFPTNGAESLVRITRGQHAVPILFPEWPREGINETERILDVHRTIASHEPACVPPIPQSFDLAHARFPTIILWNADGNHSAPAGAFLASLVIATTMTGVSPSTLPNFPQLAVSAENQTRLRGIAAETVVANSPWQWCPADRPQ
jgi:hypothetical protein